MPRQTWARILWTTYCHYPPRLHHDHKASLVFATSSLSSSNHGGRVSFGVDSCRKQSNILTFLFLLFLVVRLAVWHEIDSELYCLIFAFVAQVLNPRRIYMKNLWKCMPVSQSYWKDKFTLNLGEEICQIVIPQVQFDDTISCGLATSEVKKSLITSRSTKDIWRHMTTLSTVNHTLSTFGCCVLILIGLMLTPWNHLLEILAT